MAVSKFFSLKAIIADVKGSSLTASSSKPDYYISMFGSFYKILWFTSLLLDIFFFYIFELLLSWNVC